MLGLPVSQGECYQNQLEIGGASQKATILLWLNIPDIFMHVENLCVVFAYDAIRVQKVEDMQKKPKKTTRTNE